MRKWHSTVLTLVATAMLVVATALPSTASGSSDVGHGKITWYKTSGRDAAAHKGNGKLYFRQGAFVQIIKGSHKTWVHVTDLCDGSACEDLDVTQDTFKRLGVSPSTGVVSVTFRCGKTGQKPLKKCLHGGG